MTAPKRNGLRTWGICTMTVYTDKIKILFLLFAAHTALKGGWPEMIHVMTLKDINWYEKSYRDQMSCHITQPYNLTSYTPKQEYIFYIQTSYHNTVPRCAKVINPFFHKVTFTIVLQCLINYLHSWFRTPISTHAVSTVCVVCSVTNASQSASQCVALFVFREVCKARSFFIFIFVVT